MQAGWLQNPFPLLIFLLSAVRVACADKSECDIILNKALFTLSVAVPFNVVAIQVIAIPQEDASITLQLHYLAATRTNGYYTMPRTGNVKVPHLVNW